MIKNRVLGGILLVSGTAIGAGMLALPLATAKIGYIFTAITFLICWIFMTFSALFLLEVNLWLKAENDLISMIGATLGFAGKIFAWIAYLLLLYALISAYLKASNAWLIKILLEYGIEIEKNTSLFFFALVLVTIITCGTAMVDRINRIFSVGLVLSYGILIVSAISNVNIEKIGFGDFRVIPTTMSLMTTAFGFSVIIPSLTNYLNRNVSSLIHIIIWGGLIPLIVYLLWEWVTLGIIPIKGPDGLQALAASHNDGTGVVVALERITGNHWIIKSAGAFAIFAILTSLLGVSLALFHFLGDGLKINVRSKKRFLLLFPAFVPPLLIVIFYPTGFDRILSVSGIFVAILLGIFPTWMVWIGRYHQGYSQEKFRVFGGKPLLLLVMAFYLYIVYLEIMNCFCLL